MNFRRMKRYFRNPLLFIYLTGKAGLLNWLPDGKYLKLIYRIKMGRKLNLENPEAFTEKIQWLKLYDRNPLYTQLVDKYEVRKYVAETVGEEHLIPLLGVWDCFDDIDFTLLPDSFVLKCTHDCGSFVLCGDKAKLDMAATKKKIDRAMKRNYYYRAREWAYRNVKPRIIAERYMADSPGEKLTDYKFHCFNGEMKFPSVCMDRKSKGGLRIGFFDSGWNHLDLEMNGFRSDTEVSRPDNYVKMIEFAEKLSAGLRYARVDFYEIKGKLYFGELTFYPAEGFLDFTPDSYDYLLGSWLELPEKGNN